MQIIGCDFSSSPSRRKPIVIASGCLTGGRVQLSNLQHIPSLDAFEQWLCNSGTWVGGFDMPFGLPRALVETLGWPTDWRGCMQHYAALSRADIREQFKAFCDARPVGSKFAHRATDGPAGSSPSMKWVNPPVAYMLHAGIPRLLAGGVYLPGLTLPSDPPAGPVGLEAYPGMLAREVLERRSYKSDDRHKQTADRLIARKDLIHALESGQHRLQLRLKLSHAQRDMLAQDPMGDALDATICMVQAAWAAQCAVQGDARYGLPEKMDPLEGWIVGAPFSA